MFFFPQNLGICHSGVRAMMQTMFKNRKQTWVKHIFMQLLVDFKLLRELNSYFSLMENVPETTMNCWQRLTQVCADQYSWYHLHFKLQFVIRGGAGYCDITVFISRKQSQDRLSGNSIIFFFFSNIAKSTTLYISCQIRWKMPLKREFLST